MLGTGGGEAGTFDLAPRTPVELQGLQELVVLLVGPPLPLLCDRVRLPHLTTTSTTITTGKGEA